jgi:hypothetical protein
MALQYLTISCIRHIAVGFVLASFHSVAQALPYGAPNCPTNQAAPQGFHLMEYEGRTRQTGPIGNYGLDLFVDGTLVDPTAPGTFTANETHAIRIQSRNPKQRPYRGVLLLLHHASLDLSGGMAPVAPYQSAPGCRGTTIAGVTHQNNLGKNSSQPVSWLRWDTVGTTNIKLDVSIVVDNNSTHSLFYYTQFTLESMAAVPGGAVPTASPMRTLTEQPTVTKLAISKSPNKAVVSTPAQKRCGLLRAGLFCPLTRCGWGGKLLGICK